MDYSSFIAFSPISPLRLLRFHKTCIFSYSALYSSPFHHLYHRSLLCIPDVCFCSAIIPSSSFIFPFPSLFYLSKSTVILILILNILSFLFAFTTFLPFLAFFTFPLLSLLPSPSPYLPFAVLLPSLRLPHPLPSSSSSPCSALLALSFPSSGE